MFFEMSNVVQVGIISLITSILVLIIKKLDKNINKRTVLLLILIFNTMLVLMVNMCYFCLIKDWSYINPFTAIIQIIVYIIYCFCLSQVFYDKLKNNLKEWNNEQLNSSNNNSDS